MAWPTRKAGRCADSRHPTARILRQGWDRVSPHSVKKKKTIRERIRREFVNRNRFLSKLEASPVETDLGRAVRAFSHEIFGTEAFSLEGAKRSSLLDRLIEGAAERGVIDITLGMAHRGRLNVLANVIGNLCERIFAAFEGSVHPGFRLTKAT